MDVFNSFTDEQLDFLNKMPVAKLINRIKAERMRRDPDKFNFFKSLKVGDCFMDVQLKCIYVYKITVIEGETITCTEAVIDFECDNIDVYVEISHSIEFAHEFAVFTKISEHSFDQFINSVDRMNEQINELHVGTVQEARDIFSIFI